jgi:hypothetical protein
MYISEMYWWRHSQRKEFKVLDIDGSIREIAHMYQCPLIMVIVKGSPRSKHCYTIWSYYDFDRRESITTKLFEYMVMMGIGKNMNCAHNTMGYFVIDENEKLDPHHIHSYKHLYSHKLVITNLA